VDITNRARPYAGYLIDEPGYTVKTSQKELLDTYELMYKMRRMEVAADLLYKAKLIRFVATVFCFSRIKKTYRSCGGEGLLYPPTPETPRRGRRTTLLLSLPTLLTAVYPPRS